MCVDHLCQWTTSADRALMVPDAKWWSLHGKSRQTKPRIERCCDFRWRFIARNPDPQLLSARRSRIPVCGSFRWEVTDIDVRIFSTGDSPCINCAKRKVDISKSRHLIFPGVVLEFGNISLGWTKRSDQFSIEQLRRQSGPFRSGVGDTSLHPWRRAAACQLWIGGQPCRFPTDGGRMGASRLRRIGGAVAIHFHSSSRRYRRRAEKLWRRAMALRRVQRRESSSIWSVRSTRLQPRASCHWPRCSRRLDCSRKGTPSPSSPDTARSRPGHRRGGVAGYRRRHRLRA